MEKSTNRREFIRHASGGIIGLGLGAGALTRAHNGFAAPEKSKVAIIRNEKAISDLQGRIQAEQAMLSNEQAKLTALYQAAQADRWAQEQKTRELSITQLGSSKTLTPVTY